MNRIAIFSVSVELSSLASPEVLIYYGTVSSANKWKARLNLILASHSNYYIHYLTQIKKTAGIRSPITPILGVVFTFLDGCLCESTTPDSSHCTPHALVPSKAGCCQKIYRCSKCGGQWKELSFKPFIELEL